MPQVQDNQNSSFPNGITSGPQAPANPTFAVDRAGNLFTAGNLKIGGQLQLTGGGTLGETLDNNEFLSGLTTTNLVKNLIGVNTSNQVSIDSNALGVILGGSLSAGSTNVTTLTASGAVVLQSTLSVTGALTLGTLSAGSTNVSTFTASGAALLQSPLNVLGVLTASNTTDASSSTVAGVVMSGGLAVAKSAFFGSTINGAPGYFITSPTSGTGFNAISFTTTGAGGVQIGGDSSNGGALGMGNYAVGITAAGNVAIVLANSGNTPRWSLQPTTFNWGPFADNSYALAGDATHTKRLAYVDTLSINSGASGMTLVANSITGLTVGTDGTLTAGTTGLAFTTAGQLAAGTTTVSGGLTIGAGGLLTVGTSMLIKSNVALTDATAAQVATMTNGPTAGNPTKWISISDAGVIRRIPCW